MQRDREEGDRDDQRPHELYEGAWREEDHEADKGELAHDLDDLKVPELRLEVLVEEEERKKTDNPREGGRHRTGIF